MIKGQKISLCIPCRNEGANITGIVAMVPNEVDEIIIISNKSTDNTVRVAKAIKDKRVRVLVDDRTRGGIGYGFAHMTGFTAAKGDIIVASDGDATYPLSEIPAVVRYLISQELDFISCNRYPLQDGTRIPLKLRLGVTLLNWEIGLLYGKRIKDSLSGMWIFRKSILDQLQLTMGDWNLSPQIKLNAVRHKNIRFTEYGIVQHDRLGDTKQHYFKTGFSHAIWILRSRFIRRST